jgi:starvation-inducible DNA-binding protein
MSITTDLPTDESNISVEKLSILLANTYTLYLKTQNYHWNVVDPYFSDLHALFEKQYTELAESVDEIAERIRTLGAHAPGTFAEFLTLKTLDEAKTNLTGQEMLKHLSNDHQAIIHDLRVYIKELQDSSDEGTKDFFIGRLKAHEKLSWIIQSHFR